MISSAKLRRLLELNRNQLLSFPNVRTVGIGYVMVNGKRTEELGIIVGVSEKLPASDLPKDGILLKYLTSDGVHWDIRVDVQRVGEIRLLSENDSDS
jgi:hypothetical protein